MRKLATALLALTLSTFVKGETILPQCQVNSTCLKFYAPAGQFIGNVQAGSFTGDGSGLTNVPGTFGSSTVAVNASMYGNGANATPLGVNSSSVAVLNASGFVPNSELDPSSITKQGLITLASLGFNYLLPDNITKIQNFSDPTKQQAWDLSGMSSGATLTIAPLFSANKTLYYQPLIDSTGNVIVQNGSSGLILIGTSTALGGSNAGIQYSNLVANRAQIRVNAFGNHAGVSGMTCAKSRGTSIGDNQAVIVGDPICRTTVQAGATTPGSLPISADATFVAAQVNSLTVATDYNMRLMNKAGTLGTRWYVTSEGAGSLGQGLTASSGTFSGNVAAGSFTGDGSGLTNLPTTTSTVTHNGSLTGNGTGGSPLGVDSSSVAVLNGSGYVQNSELDPSVVTKQGFVTLANLTGAVPQGSVDFSTITSALAGKLDVNGTAYAVALGGVDFSTITAALGTKASSGTNTDITSLTALTHVVVNGDVQATTFNAIGSVYQVDGQTVIDGDKKVFASTVAATNLKMTNGATAGYVLQSDASGNASWQPASVVTPVNIRGLFVHASVSPNDQVRNSEGLATISGTMRYAPVGNVGITPAAPDTVVLAIYQVDDTSTFSIKYGTAVSSLAGQSISDINPATVVAITPGTSQSGVAPSSTTVGASHGMSTSANHAAVTISSGNLDINLDGDGVQTVVLSANSTGNDISDDIQTQVRALTANNPANQSAFDNFTSTHVHVQTAGTLWGVQFFGATNIGLTPDATNYTQPYNDLTGIAFDGVNMWATAESNDAVIKIDPAGNGTAYNGTGSVPYRIAFDGTNMWTSNTNGASVTKVDPSGSMTTYSGLSSNPRGIAADSSGNVWVTLPNNSGVAKIDQSGTITEYNSITGASPFGIAFDGTNMWTSNYTDNTVTKVDPSGVGTTYPVSGPNPWNLAFDGVNMWVCNGNGPHPAVTKVDPTGAATTYTDLTNFGLCKAIAFDGINMWIQASMGPDALYKIDSAGTMTRYENSSLGITNTIQDLAFSGVNNDYYQLASGAIGSNSTVVISTQATDDRSVDLKLGLANGGTETTGTASLLRLDLNGDGFQSVSLDSHSVDGIGVAVDIMTKVRALTAASPSNQPAFDNFTATYSPGEMWLSNSNDTSATKVFSDGQFINYPSATQNSDFGASDGLNIWYSNGGNDTVTVVSTAGYVTTYSGALHAPEGIAFDGLNMWVANLTADSVTKIDPSGSMTEYTGTGHHPIGIAFDGVNMWTANRADDSVTKIDPSGAMTTYSGTGHLPFGIAFDGVNMWTANSAGSPNSVTKVDPAGSMTTYPLTANLGPTNIAFDGVNMWTANASSNSVTKIDPSGTTTDYPDVAAGPNGIAFDGVNMWTANQGDSSVSKIDPSGTATVFPMVANSQPTGITFAHTPEYYLVSGLPGTGSAVVVGSTTLDDAAPDLKLGVANGGLEISGIGANFQISINADGFQTVHLTSSTTGAETAGDIQAKVRALTANSPSNQAAFDNFTAVYTGGPNYVLTSGVGGAGSSVVVIDAVVDDIAASLKLGVPNGGTETTPTSPTYPTADANNIELAKLFSAASPISSTTTAVTNGDINNDVPGR